MKKCLICGKDTEIIFGVNFKKVSVCDSCASQISIQQVEHTLNEVQKREIKKEADHPSRTMEIVIRETILGIESFGVYLKERLDEMEKKGKKK